MNREDIEHMWKVASNNPNHDTNWHDPVVVAFAELVAKHTLANIDPSSFMSWQEGYEAGKQAEREACLAGVKKVFGTFDSLPQSPEINLVRSLTSTFFEAIKLEIEQRAKS